MTSARLWLVREGFALRCLSAQRVCGSVHAREVVPFPNERRAADGSPVRPAGVAIASASPREDTVPDTRDCAPPVIPPAMAVREPPAAENARDRCVRWMDLPAMDDGSRSNPATAA